MLESCTENGVRFPEPLFTEEESSQTVSSNRCRRRAAAAGSALLFVAGVFFWCGYTKIYRGVSISTLYEVPWEKHHVILARTTNLSKLQLCNSSQAAPRLITPRSFHLPLMWQEACRRVRYPTNAWLGGERNWCWVWMMQQCYWHRDYTWWEIQEVVADGGLAPHPRNVPIPGLQNAGLCDRHDHGKPLANVSLLEKRAALAWVEANVAIHVLNLPSDTAKWKAISRRFLEVGIKNFTRIPGIDMTGRGALQKAQQEGWVPKSWNHSEAWTKTLKMFKSSTAKEQHDKSLMDMGMGTIGCAAAHLRAMKRAKAHAEAEHKPLIIIFEDDARIEDDFAVKLRRLVEQEVPCDWDAISLMSQCPYGVCVTPHLARIQPDGNEPEYRCYHGGTYGFYGMLYRTSSLGFIRSRLWEIMWDASRPSCLPVDVAMASIANEVAYYAVPQTQLPGFLREKSSFSHRLALNHIAEKKSGASLESSLKGKERERRKKE